MSSDNRREREVEEMRELILSTATEMIQVESIDKLSIRKIASKIEYAPSIIYHYFKDKDEILNIILQRNYQKIMEATSVIKLEKASPQERIAQLTRQYMNAALEMPKEYLAAQLNGSETVLKYTATLYKGASQKKGALFALCQSLKEIYQEKEVQEDTIEIIAQMIVVSALGLTMKLIVEKEINEEQKNKLIDFFVNEVVLKIAACKI